ncbi:MAG: divalent-cation tolerance protein CutA [Acidobacteriota bacterium]
MTDALVVFTTTAEEAQAEILARLLVDKQISACVQIIGRIRSFYRWQGEVQSANESLIIIKTTRQAYAAVEEAIKTMHRESGGYETPEIIALPVEGGALEYLEWLTGSIVAGRIIEG